MSTRRKPTPSYLLHRQSNRARAVWTDPAGVRRQKLLPGPYNSAESRAAFGRLQLELATSAVATATTTPGISVNEVFLAFDTWAVTHYRDGDGRPTTEVKELRLSFRPLREVYGLSPAAEFGPKKLAALRQRMVDLGWCRTLINRRVERVKRAFRWAAAEELVPVAVYQALRALPGLQKGRCTARESVPVGPVDPVHVAAVLPLVRPPVAAMIRLQQMTGMRPQDVCRLRLAEVDRSDEVWVYRPERHKTAHKGKARVVPIGPRGQAALTEFLRGDHPPPAGYEDLRPDDHDRRWVAADAYDEVGRPDDAAILRDLCRSFVVVAGCVVDPDAAIFNPARDREVRFRVMRARRKSKVQPSQRGRRKANPERTPAGEYHPHAYTSAIAVACDRGGVPHWHPNQLRHSFATAVRRLYGIEAAQVLLGHQRADVTQVYAERNLALGVKVAAEIG